MMVLDEELLVGLAFFWWYVVLVLRATLPNYEWEARQAHHKVGLGKEDP